MASHTVKRPWVIVARDLEEGSGTIRSISPLEVNEKRRLPDGTSHAWRFSLCAVNRVVPAELKARRFNSAGMGIRLTRALLARLQISTKISLGGWLVSKANKLP